MCGTESRGQMEMKDAAMSRKKKKGRDSRWEDMLPDHDERFAYIVGYTPWGIPYGVTWEEQAEMERREAERGNRVPEEEEPEPWVLDEEEQEAGDWPEAEPGREPFEDPEPGELPF